MNYKSTILVAICLAMSFTSHLTFGAEPEDQQKLDQINADLDSMAQQLAALTAAPGFRGFLRSEISKSKNRESILSLDRFLERAAKQRNPPPGLAKLDKLNRTSKGRVKTAPDGLQGYDLYIPVEAHRAKWKGGKNFIVAFAPVGDDQKIQEITGYSVADGKKVRLDAKKPPETVVLIVAPEEHETHEAGEAPPTITEADRKIPKPHVKGRDIADKPVEQPPGNSYVGMRRMFIRDVKEPWYAGAPEIYAHIAQRRGNYCENAHISRYSDSLERFDNANVWRTTWSPQYDYQNEACGRPRERADRTCAYFDNNYSNKMRVYIYESDFNVFSYVSNPIVFDLYPGVSCSLSRYRGDDYIDSATLYRDNFPFEYDYRHDMGNAYVIWHKIH